MQELEQQLTPSRMEGSQELVDLAEALAARSGGAVDDALILAVSEATGVSEEFVRLALMQRAADTKRTSLGVRFSSFFLSLNPMTRLMFGGSMIGFFMAASNVISHYWRLGQNLTTFLMMVGLMLVGWMAVRARDGKHALAMGVSTLFGACVGFALVGTFANLISGEPRSWLVPEMLFIGLPAVAFGSIAFQSLGKKMLKKLGVRDAQDERRELLHQLVEIQDKLRVGQRQVSFLSIDIVGSTRLKSVANSLAVEFTFSEYHTFVERAVHKFHGMIHSTAGDGVTAAFDTPEQAFQAARMVQSGLPEFNQYRNRIGEPVVLRAGIHHGTVTPQGDGVDTVNFAEVIDIAAHLQKACPAGGITVSDHAASLLSGGAGSVGSEQILVDRVPAWIWTPRVAAPLVQAKTAPAFMVPPPPPSGK
ncbi:MAG: adenylate/guanylate cyclase domain-containing protein [Armatimonadetes bacterium]|nr:adenylate/guanylate cyclase domain-containing protein [Armatimonadota bacterium]